MRNWGCRSCVASLMAALWAITIEAADYKRFDGVHRIEKSQITQPAMLARRDEGVCGTSSKLCPSSLDGGCCPDDYKCAKESCYATTKGPSTCGTKVGWYGCEAVYGGGCCPDGYLCQTADACIPPSGSAYTFGCPTNQYLCPSSLSYGCCPNGMGCAVNQCYSTEPVTVTTTMVITTTEDGSRTTYKTTAITVSTPDEPTVLPTVDTGDDSDQYILKYFPSAVSKVAPSSSSSSDDSDGGSGGLSTGALAGIIAGSIAFLIIVLVAAFIIIRHLNKVVAAVSTPRRSDASKSRPSMKEFKPTDSEGDTLSINPLMVPPRPPAPGPESNPSPYNLGSPDYSSNDHTPSGGGAGYQPVSGSAGNSRHTSFDAAGPNDDYFNAISGAPRFSQSTVSAPRMSNDSHGTYTHVRNWSNASDGSDGTPGWNAAAAMELEANPYVPELPHSPSSVAFPRDDRRRSSGGSTVSNTARPPIAHQRQRNRSESLGQSALGVVDEEMHGFYGSANHLVGQTDSHRPGTGKTKNGPKASEGGEGEGDGQGDGQIEGQDKPGESQGKHDGGQDAEIRS